MDRCLQMEINSHLWEPMSKYRHVAYMHILSNILLGEKMKRDFDQILLLMQQSFHDLESGLIYSPELFALSFGKAFRYKEKNIHQALILKLARVQSAPPMQQRYYLIMVLFKNNPFFLVLLMKQMKILPF